MFSKLKRFKRRPSASMIVATMALFVALSGGAYAAVAIPNDSVGFNQLKAGAVGFKTLAAGSVGFRDLAAGAVGTKDLANNSVTYNKIAPGQIGHARVSQSQIQWRVTGTCAGEFAIQSITNTGAVTCAQSLPSNYTTAGLSEPLTSSTTPVVLASQSLPAATGYTVTADPYIQVKGTQGTENVLVTCEIAAGTATETRSASFALAANHEQQVNSIPLSVTMPATTSATSAAVACTTASDNKTQAAVQASSSMDAIQTATPTTATTAGTSTTGFTVTNPTITTATATTTTATTASTPAS